MALASACTPAAPAPAAAPTPAPPPAAAPPAAAAAVYRAVHIDTIAADKLAQFEGARRDFVAELDRARTSDHRGLMLQVEPNRFYTMFAFERFAELDPDGSPDPLAAVPAQAKEQYGKLCDDALVFPHTTEVWRRDDHLAYAPAGGGLTEADAACGRLVIEDVRPDPASSQRYWRGWDDVKSALADARYPLTRVTFRTSYGAGHLMTLWLARSREELDAAPSPEQAIARVRGEARAAELAGAQAASVERREVHAFTVRRDLSRF
jgi:hypothetical protein